MEDDGNKIKKAKKNRSAAYPSISLPDAIEGLRIIHSDLGRGPYDRESAAKSLGYTGVSGASSSKVAALVHYGLIQRVGGGYVETDLGTSVALPVDNEEETRALLNAFRSPALFSRLLTDFAGKSLPAKLEIILVRQYKITEQASKDVVKIFRDSAEYVGVLHNGFLSIDDEERSTHQKNHVDNSTRHIDPSNQSSSYTEATPRADISVEVGSGLTVVFSSRLALALATGKFSASMAQLSTDLAAVTDKSYEEQPYEHGEDETQI